MNKILKIPGDLLSTANCRWLQAGELYFGEYSQQKEEPAHNVYITEHTLVFICSGAKVFRFPDHEFTVPAQHAIFLKRGCYLMCESVVRHQEYKSIFLCFNEASLLPFWEQLTVDKDIHNIMPPEKELDHVVLEKSPAFNAFRETIVNCFNYKGNYLEQMIMLKLHELILLLLESPVGPQIEPFFSTVLNTTQIDPKYVVSNNLMKPLTLDDYAKLSNRSLSSFKKEFREKEGISPGQWILQNRLSHARLLVQSTDRTMGEISNDCGFKSASSFIRAYRKHYGMSPNAHRKKAS